jgi:hypothetical protein
MTIHSGYFGCVSLFLQFLQTTYYVELGHGSHESIWDVHGGEWSTLRSGRLTFGKEPQCPLCRRLCGPQSQSGRIGEEKNLFYLQGFEPQTIQTVS